MCRTDEARVSRIWAPGTKYDGMVERVQKITRIVPVQKQQYFELIYRDERLQEDPVPITWCQSELLYHLIKFLAMRAAKSLFPENFANLQSMFIFLKRGCLHTATYSDFVSDDTGVIERRMKTMRDYYGFFRKMSKRMDHDDEFYNAIEKYREAADQSERELNPALENLVAKISSVGITIAHPEMNYHISKNSTIFFELAGLDIQKGIESAHAASAKHAIETIIAAYTLHVVAIANNKWDKKEDPVIRRQYIRASEAEPEEIYDLIFNLLFPPDASDDDDKIKKTSYLPHAFIMRVFDDVVIGWETMSIRKKGTANTMEHAPLGEIIDPKIICLLKEYDRQDVH